MKLNQSLDPAMMAAVALNGVKLGTTSQAYLESKPVSDTKVLISDLCRQFYNLGWVSGTGGSITIKVHDDSVPKPQQLVIMSPSGNSCYGFWVFIHGLYSICCMQAKVCVFWLVAFWAFVILLNVKSLGFFCVVWYLASYFYI